MWIINLLLLQIYMFFVKILKQIRKNRIYEAVSHII